MANQYQYLRDLTFRGKVALAALHLAMDDETQSTVCRIEYRNYEKILEIDFTYMDIGQGKREPDKIMMISDQIYGDSIIVSELEKKLREMVF